MGLFASPNRAAVMNSLPPRAPRRRRRDEPDVPELRAGALDRDLLHLDDRRARRQPAAGLWSRRPPPCCAAAASTTARSRRSDPSACLESLRRNGGTRWRK
jgi:hypothetical protein